MLTKIKITLIIITLVVSNGFTWRYMDNKYKAQQLKFQQQLTEKDNEAKTKQAKHQKEIELLRGETRAKLAGIRSLAGSVDSDCPAYLDDYDRLRDELYSNFPDMHFAGTDALSGSSADE